MRAWSLRRPFLWCPSGRRSLHLDRYDTMVCFMRTGFPHKPTYLVYALLKVSHQACKYWYVRLLREIWTSQLSSFVFLQKKKRLWKGTFLLTYTVVAHETRLYTRIKSIRCPLQTVRAPRKCMLRRQWMHVMAAVNVDGGGSPPRQSARTNTAPPKIVCARCSPWRASTDQHSVCIHMIYMLGEGWCSNLHLCWYFTK